MAPALENAYLTVTPDKGLGGDETAKKGKPICQQRCIGARQKGFDAGEEFTKADIRAQSEHGAPSVSVPK